jgi:hypothetical protein
MPYLFTCPHCQTKTQVEDRYSGQSGQCVTCGGDIELPNFAGDSIAPAAAPKKDTKAVPWVIAAVVSLILLGCLLLAMIRVGGQTMNRLTTNRERSSSIQNLERIADALNAYFADHGTYPPNATRGPGNKPMHSWRVLILPYLDEEDLYNEFDFRYAWDHPDNMRAARDMPSVYQHPNRATRQMLNESGYYLITGQGTLFPNAGPLGADRVTDDPSQTILVIEGSPLVPSGMWTEPLDLDYVKIQGKLGSNPGIEPGGLLDDGVAFATVDGRGHFVPNTIEPTVFLSLITPRGGERLRDDTLD